MTIKKDITEILGLGQQVSFKDGSVGYIETESMPFTHSVEVVHDSYVKLKDLKTGELTATFNFDVHYLSPSFTGEQHYSTHRVRLQLVEMSGRAFEDYRKNVRNNTDITKDMAQRKLTRNIICAKKVEAKEEHIEKGNTAYQYGNMFIVVGKKGKNKDRDVVTYIKNGKKEKMSALEKYMSYWEVDQELYAQLSDLLGIEKEHRNDGVEDVHTVREDVNGASDTLKHRVFTFFQGMKNPLNKINK